MTATDLPQEPSDPHLSLEDVTGTDALAWVRARNAETLALHDGPARAALEAELLAVLEIDDRIPYPRRRGDHLYNFWRDASRRRGLWRRCSPESFVAGTPEWEVLVDVDALAEDEGESWVWKRAVVLRPHFDRALVHLSRGGADAVVVREFDIAARRFVPAAEGGFELPEAKSDVAWVDADTVLVGTDLGPGSTTDSGYPVDVRVWRRGTPVDEAPVLFAGVPGDVAVGAGFDPTPGFTMTTIRRATDFHNSLTYVLPGGAEAVRAAAAETPPAPVLLDVPTDASVGLHRGWLTLLPREAWTPADREFPAGSLLAIRLDDFLAGSREFEVLVEADAHTSLQDAAWTRGHLLVTLLTDVVTHIDVLTPPPSGAGAWSRRALAGLPGNSTLTVIAADSEGTDEAWIDSSGFLEPSTLWRVDLASLRTEDAAASGSTEDAAASGGTVGVAASGSTVGVAERVRSAPASFDAAGLGVSQHFALSDDGTRVPYFVVRREDADGPGPTLLGGYGGFEVSRLPGYAPVLGRAWLERGGTYVLANIRGGGEYGPAWHRAALREKRPRAFEDFAAVARDLVERGITTPDRLAARGGSNGGLLMGVMLTRYPESFGAIVCQVPLLDMRRYHLLLAGASWMAEYGDPENPDDWEFIGRYSPYQHVADAAERPYPPILLTTSTRDDRVHPGHARKMVARLREAGQPVDYHENIEGGHGGAADNRQVAFVESLTYSWLWDRVG